MGEAVNMVIIAAIGAGFGWYAARAAHIRHFDRGVSIVIGLMGAFSGAFDYYQTVPSATFPSRMTATCAADPSYVLRRD